MVMVIVDHCARAPKYKHAHLLSRPRLSLVLFSGWQEPNLQSACIRSQPTTMKPTSYLCLAIAAGFLIFKHAFAEGRQTY